MYWCIAPGINLMFVLFAFCTADNVTAGQLSSPRACVTARLPLHVTAVYIQGIQE